MPCGPLPASCHEDRSLKASSRGDHTAAASAPEGASAWLCLAERSDKRWLCGFPLDLFVSLLLTYRSRSGRSESPRLTYRSRSGRSDWNGSHFLGAGRVLAVPRRAMPILVQLGSLATRGVVCPRRSPRRR